VPTNGSFIHDGTTGADDRVAAGALFRVTDCATLGGCAASVTVDDYPVASLDHLTRIPSDCLHLPTAARGKRERHGVDPVDELVPEATRRDLRRVRAENLMLELMLGPGPRDPVAVPTAAAHVARPPVPVRLSLPPGRDGFVPRCEHLLDPLVCIVDRSPGLATERKPLRRPIRE
jgi:hypothetical protein